MSSKKFFEELQSGQEPTLLETLKEAASVVRDAGGSIWDGTRPMFDHGRTEAVSALFAGHGHVLYMHTEKPVDEPLHGLSNQPEVERDTGRDL